MVKTNMKKLFFIFILLTFFQTVSAVSVPDFFEKGSNGSKVKNIQEFFNKFFGTNLVVDGKYGKDTEAAVRKIQEQLGTDQTGKLDQEMLKKMEASVNQKIGEKNNSNLGSSDDCKNGKLEGDLKNILGCGKATNYGHDQNGNKDPVDDGNNFCNTNNDPEKYSFLPKPKNPKKKGKYERETNENLNYCFAALRAKDIAKLLNVDTNGKKLGQIRRALAPKRKEFCEKELRVRNNENGKEIKVKLMDIMSSNDKVIDLTGGCLQKLGKTGTGDLTISSVLVEWADQPGMQKGNTQVAGGE
jgi:hypothetical protein